MGAHNVYNDTSLPNNLHGETYPYLSEAVALAYIMNELNMGVTLSRSLGGGTFKIINVQQPSASAGMDVSGCGN
jgi:hypothetical protein